MPKKTKQPQKSTADGFYFNPIDWLCIGFGFFMSIITPFVDHGHSLVYIIISIIMLMCGIFEMILGVRGRRSNYIFAIVNTLASFYIAWVDHYYGNMVINVYYVFICLFGFYSWGKHRDKKKDVIARKLNAKQILIATLTFALSSIGLFYTLEYFGGHFTVLDSTSTVLIIFASILGALRYREQWIIWIIVNILTLIMWAAVGNPATIGMKAFYVIGSIYGYLNWRSFIRKNN